jgi:hypothetical protein
MDKQVERGESFDEGGQGMLRTTSILAFVVHPLSSLALSVPANHSPTRMRTIAAGAAVASGASAKQYSSAGSGTFAGSRRQRSSLTTAWSHEPAMKRLKGAGVYLVRRAASLAC